MLEGICFHLCDFDALRLWVVLIHSTDECAEKLIKIFFAVCHDSAPNGPDYTEQEHPLQPECYLETIDKRLLVIQLRYK